MPIDMMNQNDRENARPPLAEFEGYAECSLFLEDVKISLTENEVVISALFDHLILPYSEITSFTFENNRVSVQTEELSVCFSRMGQQAEWLYDKLSVAYNDAVLKALKVSGECLFEADASFALKENGAELSENGKIHLYEDCICLLPSNENARRIPLCFVKSMKKGDYSVTLILSEREQYTISKMGRELDYFEHLFVQSMRKLQDKTAAWHRELAPNLRTLQLSASAKLMPYSTAASLKELMQSAPELAKALQAEIKRSRIAKTFPWLKALSVDDSLAIGAKPAPLKEEGEELPAEEVSDESAETETKEEPTPILWVAAPDKEKRIVAVELALADNESAATYLYRISGEWKDFSMQIDRALEATSFERELITISEEKLCLPEKAQVRILIRRTPSLQLLRKCFMGKAIHSSQERWIKDIKKHSEKEPKTKGDVITENRFCTNCGSKLNGGMRFCGQCGSKIY